MKSVTAKWVIIPLFVFVAIFTACSNSAGESSNTNLNIDDSVGREPTAVAGSSEVVAGDLGGMLDDFITQDNPLFSGSILVARDGQFLLSKGYNFANWELNVPNSSLTKFRISSITKPFTATMILMLVERDLLNLDDQLCAYLVDCPDAWQEITIQDLLAHTSGVPEYTTLSGAVDKSRQRNSLNTLINTFRDEPLEFDPGDTYQYSNSNYILLGAVIEAVTGGYYGSFLQNAILSPLDLEDSGMDSMDRILKDRAAGYQIQGGVLINAPYLDMSNAYATAGMYSTVGDLYAFIQALEDGQLLNRESQALMYAPDTADDGSGAEYGLGWQVTAANGHPRVGHSGGINGYRVFMGSYPEDQVKIIVLSNIETEDVDQIVEGLEQIMFNQE